MSQAFLTCPRRISSFRKISDLQHTRHHSKTFSTHSGRHRQYICQPPARWFTPNVVDHQVCPSTQASQILKLPRIGRVQDHSGHPGTSQLLTPQPPSCKATSQDPADTEPIHTNVELVGFLTISQNQTIFEISIRRTSIENVGSGSCSPSCNLHSKVDKLATSPPIQTPCWAFAKHLCGNSSVKKPLK